MKNKASIILSICAVTLIFLYFTTNNFGILILGLESLFLAGAKS